MSFDTTSTQTGRSHQSSETPTAPRIVLLMTGGPMGWSVANALARRFDNLHLLIEEPEAKWAIVRRRARLLGWPRALGQAAGGVAHKFLARASQSRIDRLCQAQNLLCAPQPEIPAQHVGSVNSEACRAALAALRPAVVAVYGTRIIRLETLRAIAVPVLNYHAGINPKYRGQHPGYWALVNRDAENAGVTIHVVDEGVDTGGVVAQARVDFEPSDNITTYQWRQLVVALPLLQRAIEDAAAGRLEPYRVNLPSAQHFPPTLWAYAWYGATRGVW